MPGEKKIGWVLFLLLLISACKNKDQRTKAPDVIEAPLFLDYKISGEEGYDKLTVLASFRDGGMNEDGLILKDGAKVELDGEVFPVDSAERSGAFYELYKPINGFSGKHSIVYTSPGGKKYTEEFNFEPMVFRSEVPEVLLRSDVFFDIGGIDADEKVKVLITDTSFINDGINKLYNVEDGRLRVPPIDLEEVDNGPVQLELIKEVDRPLKNATSNGGRLRISYTLRRSFTLDD